MATNRSVDGQMRQPRLADIVAATLRERIIDGEIADGDLLPPLDGLVGEFGVSAPSIREALRILESERLITVRRGNVGGAIVHQPKAEAVAYMLGLVLQSDRVRMTDLAIALIQLEPTCAGLCAGRPDRNEAVVPKLRTACENLSATMDEPRHLEYWSRTFHNALIGNCGNDSLMLVVGALEELWAAQRDAWTYRVAFADESPNEELREQGLKAHVAITDAIAAGNQGLTRRLVQKHMEHPEIFIAQSVDSTIRATDISGHDGHQSARAAENGSF